MRALFVAPYLPTPGSGGRTRLINLMERLAKDHDVALVAFCARDQEPSESPYPGAALAPPPMPERPQGVGGALRFYGERLVPTPWFVRWMRSSGMETALRTEVARFGPDVAMVQTTEMAQYLDTIGRGPVRALDLQDVSSRWVGRVVGRGRTKQERALMQLELVKTRRFEQKVARIPDVVYVTSPVERAYLRDLSGVDPVEVPNGVDTATFVPLPAPGDADRILFVGPLTSDANLDAVRWFAGEVLPLVRREVAGATLDVVGTPVEETFTQGVRLLGRVDDVRAHLARAQVSVVPIRVASGTRYKILEALSMARCVVSTSAGAEGLGAGDGEHLLLADDAESFARAVVRALSDPELRARLGRAGREHVVARFDWGILAATVEESWERALAARAG